MLNKRKEKEKSLSGFKKKSWIFVDFWIQTRHETNHLHPSALSLAAALLQPFFPQMRIKHLKICHWNCRCLFCEHHVRFHVKLQRPIYLLTQIHHFNVDNIEKTCKTFPSKKSKSDMMIVIENLYFTSSSLMSVFQPGKCGQVYSLTIQYIHVIYVCIVSRNIVSVYTNFLPLSRGLPKTWPIRWVEKKHLRFSAKHQLNQLQRISDLEKFHLRRPPNLYL